MMRVNQILLVFLVQGIHLISSQLGNFSSDTILFIANRPLVQQFFLNGSGLLRIFESDESSIVGLDADLRSVE